jgi:uncharacterized repeat protein (TIGR03803 family)
MIQLNGWRAAFTIFVFCVAAANLSHAQTFTSLFSFDDADGGNPNSPLVQGVDGNLYGTAAQGGLLGDGVIFKILHNAPRGPATVHYFHGGDGMGPQGLVLDTNGDFYGTTISGGTSTKCPQGCGTIFQVTARSTVIPVHNFDVTDGNYPVAPPVEGRDGNLYGTTEEGGAGCSSGGCGTVYKLTTDTGAFTTLHNFAGADGSFPLASLVVGSNGYLYGTTSSGGLYGFGTVFEITPAGTLTTLHNFNDTTDGAAPVGALVQVNNGNFYGMTNYGAFGFGTVFYISPGGLLFHNLLDFNGADGGSALAGLVLGSDGNLYGATSEGDTSATYGTLFEITPGLVTTLHYFDGTDGGRTVMLMQAADGTFYGTNGGFGLNNNCPDSTGCGTAFSLSLDLKPFITIAPTYGWVGRCVRVLGYNLTGTTAVAFNGAPATFTVVSDTEITTNVPSGATNGLITVATPGGTLSSNATFFLP